MAIGYSLQTMEWRQCKHILQIDTTNLTRYHMIVLVNRQPIEEAPISPLSVRNGLHCLESYQKKKPPQKRRPEGENQKEEKKSLLKQLSRSPHARPRRFSSTALTAGEISSHKGHRLRRRALEVSEPVAECLRRLAIEAKGAAGREHATDELRLQRNLLHTTRRVTGDAHAR